MPSTKIPDALDALVALATVALSGEAVQVVDGPVTIAVQGDVVFVGFSADRLAVEGEQEIASLGGGARREIFEVVCLSSAWTGEPGPNDGPGPYGALRQRAKHYIDLFAAAIAEDPTLGRTVLKVQLGSSWALDQTRATEGYDVTFEFVLRVSAMT